MPAIRESARVCEICGSPIETTSSGDLGCMVCLLDVGLDGGAEESDGAFAPVPDQLGTYTIEHHPDGSVWELGRGAMGVTYRAIDKVLDRPVALKIINTGLGSRSAEARERFMREVRAAAALRHPNVATVYQFGVREETGQFFYAMELVEGETIEERVRRLGPLDVSTTIDVALQVTAALAAAEERGLVHRDLKPGNLMLTSNLENTDARAVEALAAASAWQRVRRLTQPPLQRRERTAQRAVPTIKVIDFGVAKAIAEKTNAMALTHGAFVGTPAFASPEQFTSAPVDVRSDIYSLGATLWFLLTGHMLFGGRTVEEMRDARQSKSLPIEQLKIARVPRRFVALLVSMLAVEPAARPAGARELEARLLAIRRELAPSKALLRLAVGAGIVVATLLIVWGFYRKPTAPLLPEKSIAILPFTIIGEDKEDTYFADGIQDDVLTDLTKVPDLKVISRRSAAQYRDTRTSTREIGQALQVSHLLEGSVRKVAGGIHVTAQLIDTRDEKQTWAEKYDRDIADLFQIQSEISQAIVTRLKATLSPAARAAIEEKPTQDDEAYDLYLRARALVYAHDLGVSQKTIDENNRKAITLLDSAIARDPNFALAYCVLGEADLLLEESDKAKEAVEVALRISPNSAEAHLVHARYFLGVEDVSAAEKELTIAAAGLPGRADVFALRADVETRRGQWKQALHDREKASELDPQDLTTIQDLIFLNIELRNYVNAERLLDQTIAIAPQQSIWWLWIFKSYIALARGDAKAAMAALDYSPDRHRGFYNENHLLAHVFLMERNYSRAEEILQSAEEIAKKHNVLANVQEHNEAFLRGITLEKLGRIARFRGEQEKAKKYFEAARPLLEEWLAKNPGDHSWHGSHAPAYIAEIDAALGHKEDAIREGRRIAELWPFQRNALIASNIQVLLAVVYMWSGERDAALQQLMEVARVPVIPPSANMLPGFSAGELKLNPIWDDLRSDPRFDKIIAEAAKPVKLD